MTYPDVEKAVFERLWQKHKQEPSFTFSVRKKASKGAEADYFIGTKTSSYFGFTCWHIPIYYPGASTDFCNFMVGISGEGATFYFQTNTPNAEEKLTANHALQACHFLAHRIAENISKTNIPYQQSAEQNAMYWIGAYPQMPNSPVPLLEIKVFLEKLSSFIDLMLPVVDGAIEDTKKQYPDFPGKRIDLAQFQLMIDKMKIRQARYKVSTQFDPIEPESLPLLNAPPIDLAILPSKNLLLYGPPGTGKTYYLQTQLLEYFREGETKRYTFVTFHQAFSYEDFIEGLKPETDGSAGNQIQYKVKPGVFYTACNEAAKLAGFDSLSHSLEVSQEEREDRFASAPPYALFIDEINRANVSATFGELITLLEPNKRLGADQEMTDVLLPYSKKPFGVPSNLYLIGTMNTADRSVEALDTALRRRFLFREMVPNESLLEQVIADIPLSQLLRTINLRLERLLSREQRIGHAYLLAVQTEEDLMSAFDYSIIPLLQEYFYGDYQKIGLVLGNKFVSQRVNEVKFAHFNEDLAADYQEVSLWDIKPATIDAIQSIL